MAEVFLSPKQARPAAATVVDLYAVPAGRSATSSTIAVCNTGTAQTTFRIAVRPAGAVLDAVHFLYFDAAIGANVTLAITIGVTLTETDVVSVQSANGSVNFHLYGMEVF